MSQTASCLRISAFSNASTAFCSDRLLQLRKFIACRPTPHLISYRSSINGGRKRKTGCRTSVTTVSLNQTPVHSFSDCIFYFTTSFAETQGCLDAGKLSSANRDTFTPYQRTLRLYPSSMQILRLLAGLSLSLIL